MKAHIMDIKRFAVHDGDGIRTTIFFKGCPLRCVWCHNPEGLLPQKQMAYNANRCLNCGNCTSVCAANTMVEGKHVFDRTVCNLCRECEKVCPSGCFRIYGTEYTVEELLDIILEDKDFYDCSGGGVTLSGGECLAQVDFCVEFLKRCKDLGIHTAVDTCGFVVQESFEKVLPYTDIFLYDVKAIDEDVHIKCTGFSNKLILDNLKYLSEMKKKVEIRIPYVPGYNSDQIEKIADFLRELHNITDVKILPFHNLSESKYTSLNMECYMPQCKPPGIEEINSAISIIKNIL